MNNTFTSTATHLIITDTNMKTMAALLALHSMGNALILKKIVLPMLENDSLLMAHTDPSIIIDTPFPLEKLFSFVAISLMWHCVISFIDNVILKRETHSTNHNEERLSGISCQSAMVIAVHTIIIHIIFIICGIHPTILPLHTLLSALYVSLNTPQSIHQFMAANWSVNQHQFPNEHAKAQSKDIATRLHIHHALITLGSIIGMIACAILRVLDHGMQIQRYPIPIIVGATWGSCGGVAVAVILAFLGYKQ